MKTKILIAFAVLIVNYSTHAQNNKVQQKTNILKLRQIAEFEKNKSLLDKQLALSMAKLNNWKISFENAGGSFVELIRTDANGNPVYYKTYNRGASVTSRTDYLYNGGGLGLQIEGQNMIIGEWDGAGVLLTHEALTGRVTQMDSPSYTHPHSTHVAGTLIGSDQVAGGNARGMAFKAALHAYDWNDDTSELATAAANGLLISNHSYGYSNPSQYLYGKYDDEAHIFDDIMYNAPYYLTVCAAGNSRDDGVNSGDNGYDLLSGHSCSKNSIVVAAVHEVNNYTDPTSVQMSYFSSWGPTDDGRIKPDISAKGVDVYSSIDSSNTAYDTYSGTSMASPSTAGTLLLLQQYYKQKNGNFMRAATLRGLALHSADEAGNNPGPDYEFGWGLLNAKKAAEIIRDNNLTSYVSEQNLSNGSTYSITVNALGTEPLMATICWTDPAGATVTDSTEDLYVKSLINDLDIRITHNSTTYMPWKLDVNNPSLGATNGDNDVDNIEKIQIDAASGCYTITVSHKGTLSNNQNFSIILSGVAFDDFYITSNDSNTHSICIPENTADYNMHLTTIPSFSGTVQFSTVGLPASITSTFTPTSLTNSGDFQLNISNINSVSAGTYPFIIKGRSGSDTVEYNAVLRVLDSNFSPQNLLSPTDNALSVALNPILTWDSNSNAEEYQLQLSDDINFNNLLVDITTTQLSHQVSGLNHHTAYYWRVKPNNICSEGNFSSIFTFTTLCQAPQNITASNLLLDAVDLTWNDPNSATQWEIEIIEENASPTGTGIIVGSNPYTFTGLNSNTTYKAYIRSICAQENSAWGISNYFTTASDYCNGDHFYDTGGASGSYSNNENIITTIAPSTGFNSLIVAFNSFKLEQGYDNLYIYNGSDTNATLIGQYTGTNSPGTISSNNPSGCLTFKFTSDYSVVYSGWDASVSCINITCPNPSDFNVSNILSDTVDLSWDNGGSETQWQIEYGDVGFSLGSGTLLQVSSNPYNLTGLNPNSNYDVYLRANCGANPNEDDSDWMGPISFTTSCAVISAPFLDNIEGHAVTSSAQIENCWTTNPENTTVDYRWNVSSGGTPSSDTGPNAAHSGSNYFYTESSGYNTGDVSELYTPLIDITNLTTPYLTFYYHMYGFNMGSLHVDVYNNSTWTNDEIVINGQQQTSGDDAWIEQNLVLNNYSGTIQIRFRSVRGNDFQSDMAIDDIRIDEMPTCPIPSNFAVSNIGLNTAEISWDIGYSETNWQLEYGFAGFTQGFGTIIQTSDNPFVLTGLIYNKDYDIYLKAVCGANPGDDDSYWVGPLHFKTADIEVPQNLTASINQSTGEVILNWDNISTHDNAPNSFVRYNIYRNSTQIGISSTTTYTDNLSNYGDYTYYVTALYNEGESSSSNVVNISYVGIPNISVTPTSLSETLEQGQTSTQYLTITNSGDANLNYNINNEIISSNNNMQTGNWHSQNGHIVFNSENIENHNISFDFLTRTYDVPNVSNNVLIYDVEDAHNYVAALTNLGASFTQETTESNFINSLNNNTWELVILNQYNNYLSNTALDAVNTYIASGGKLIMSYWAVNENSSHVLYSELGFSFNQNISEGYNINAVNSSHSIFTTPNTISTFNSTNNRYNIDGQDVSSINNSSILALLNNASNSPAIILNANNNTIFNTFGSYDYNSTTIVKLIENEITYLDSAQNQWIGTTPSVGVISSGTTFNVAVHFNAMDLAPGTYHANININSNDPNTPLITVPVTLTVTACSCHWVTDLVTNVTGTEVELSWTNGGTETQWEIEYGPTGFSHGSGTSMVINSNPYTLSNLDSNTNYDIYVRAICGTNPGDDDSIWTSPIHFTTGCGIASPPFLDNVEGHTVTSSAQIENCWTTNPENTTAAYRWNVSNGGTPSSDTGPNTAHSGSNYFYTESSGYNTGDISELYTPLIDLSGLTVAELSFYYYMYGANMGSLHVDILSNGIWTNDEIVITGQQQTSGYSAWLNKSLVLSNYNGIIQIRFRSIRGNGYESDMAIDDIKVDENLKIDPVLDSYNFKYYPNPTLSNLYLSASKNITSLQIYNLLGQELLSTNPKTTHYDVNIEHLEAGTYLLKVKIDNLSGYYRFIKK